MCKPCPPLENMCDVINEPQVSEEFKNVGQEKRSEPVSPCCCKDSNICLAHKVNRVLDISLELDNNSLESESSKSICGLDHSLFRYNVLFEDSLNTPNRLSDENDGIACLGSYSIYANPLWCDNIPLKDRNLFLEDESILKGSEFDYEYESESKSENDIELPDSTDNENYEKANANACTDCNNNVCDCDDAFYKLQFQFKDLDLNVQTITTDSALELLKEVTDEKLRQKIIDLASLQPSTSKPADSKYIKKNTESVIDIMPYSLTEVNRRLVISQTPGKYTSLDDLKIEVENLKKKLFL
ncbi:hypothetical protein FXO37_26713 [Capsicum annuum]|nr:hypothetical protein FXO37_26713 [Capsicum annuum]